MNSQKRSSIRSSNLSSVLQTQGEKKLPWIKNEPRSKIGGSIVQHSTIYVLGPTSRQKSQSIVAKSGARACLKGTDK